MKILNLTQHIATPQQIFEPSPFEEPPSYSDLKQRAAEVAALASQYQVQAAMIGGAPFFMAPLEAALLKAGIQPLYAFSKRRIKEVMDPETGEVTKQSCFVFETFVKGGVK